ncbi:hypothetical protein TRVA0_001S01904 [Trichomonascus vanleenenianus]|uniref:uncharacterized protein n=1 Tax=Trichomonascus vanleenenianus TaxID=2268995 RepID=UPI003ECA4E34
MEKDEESNQPEPNARDSENEAGTRANQWDPNESLNEEDLRDWNALPEDVRRRFLEGVTGNTLDYNAKMHLTAWAFSHHPRLQPGFTLVVEEIPGQGFTIVPRLKPGYALRLEEIPGHGRVLVLHETG